MQRRTFGKLLGGIVAGGAGIAYTTRDASALAVDISELSIPDETIDTAIAIQNLYLNLRGTWAWDTVETPTRAVLRVELTHNRVTEQIGATLLSDPLTAKDSGTYAFSRLPLGDHSEVTISDLTPETVGNTNTFEFTITVRLTARNADGQIGEETVSTDATLTVSRTEVQLNATLDGTGNFTASTATPN